MIVRRCLAALALVVPSVAAADPLVLTKTSIVVADQVNALNPKAIPNATLDYAIRVDNPNSVLSARTIGAVVIEDALPAGIVLRVADYAGAGAGPIEFADGNLLGLGLTGSGLRYNVRRPGQFERRGRVLRRDELVLCPGRRRAGL